MPVLFNAEVALLLDKQKKNYQEKGIRVPECVHIYVHATVLEEVIEAYAANQLHTSHVRPQHSKNLKRDTAQDADTDAGVLQALRQREGPRGRGRLPVPDQPPAVSHRRSTGWLVLCLGLIEPCRSSSQYVDWLVDSNTHTYIHMPRRQGAGAVGL